jgi:ATP-dependent DNA ligase
VTGNFDGYFGVPGSATLAISVSSFTIATLPFLRNSSLAAAGRAGMAAHEIKHDGFRIMARRDDNGVRLYTPQRI